jgi:hypothetical protein
MRCSIYLAFALMTAFAPAFASPLYQLVPESAATAFRAPDESGISVAATAPNTVTWTYDNVKGGTTFRSLLARPVPIPRDARHIAFWLDGQNATVKPIVVDSHGQEFVYETRSLGNGWRYVSTLLIDPYNGGAINNRDLAAHSGGDNDGVPKAPLSLTGVEIKTGSLSSDSVSIRSIAFDLSNQSDSFSQWSLNGRCLKSIVPGAEEPFLFASELCHDAGRFRILWRTYDLSETRLLWQGEQDIDYDPERSAPPPGDRIRIAVLTPGTYSLNVSVIDRDADPADIGARMDSSYRLQILRGAQISPPLPANARPLGTLIGFNVEKAGRVYASKEPKVVTVRFWKPDGAGPFLWTYWWRQGIHPVAGPVAPLDFGGRPFVDRAVTLAGWDCVRNPIASFEAQISSRAGVLERARTTLGGQEVRQPGYGGQFRR